MGVVEAEGPGQPPRIPRCLVTRVHSSCGTGAPGRDKEGRPLLRPQALRQGRTMKMCHPSRWHRGFRAPKWYRHPQRPQEGSPRALLAPGPVASGPATCTASQRPRGNWAAIPKSWPTKQDLWRSRPLARGRSGVAGRGMGMAAQLPRGPCAAVHVAGPEATGPQASGSNGLPARGRCGRGHDPGA